MNVENIHDNRSRLRVLVVPLDWGLGHASRCIPIVNILLKHNIDVFLAGEGTVVKILEKAQPDCVILPLKGYRIRYSHNPAFLLFKLLLQSPKIFSIINFENQWLKRTVFEHKIDAVISDNRFGLFHSSIPTVFLTHQLSIQTGNNFLNKVSQKINFRFINRFKECWVPDFQGADNLAGELSHPSMLPSIPVKYLGLLSRFEKISTVKKSGLLLLISGPEPQRSIFEDLLLSQLHNIEAEITLVRGLPLGGKKIMNAPKNLVIHQHLETEQLSALIQRSENIVARCGYSTIMDLVALNQQAILVPTPGQTEQEYLADQLMERKIFYTCPQKNFVLCEALKLASSFKNNISFPGKSITETVIIDWIQKIRKPINALQ